MPDYPVRWTASQATIMVARCENKAASRQWLAGRADRHTILLHPGEVLIIEHTDPVQLSIHQQKNEDNHAELDRRTTSDI